MAPFRYDHFVSVRVLHPIRRMLRPRCRAAAGGVRRLPILMYHSISETPEPGKSAYLKTVTPPARFADHMRLLRISGRRGVSLREGLSWLNSSADTSEEAPVAITFDDGFRDFHLSAFPAMQEYGFTATMYLPTAFIGNDRKSFKGHECLTWPEIRELAATGIEFGSHTVHHPKLVELGWSEIETELRDSKTTIEQELQTEVPAFAYPFAFPQADIAFACRFRELLTSTGYQSCVTTEIGRAAPGDDPMRLKRQPVNGADDLKLLAAKIDGAYDWLAKPQQLAKTLKRVLNRN